MPNSFDEIADHLQSLIPLIKNTLLEYRSRSSAVIKEIKDIRQLLKHMHATHAHPCCHSFNGETDLKHYNNPLFDKCQPRCFETKFYPDKNPTPVELLLKEFSTNYDQDNNNLIFLKHFIFNPNDPAVPKILKATQRIQLKNQIIPRYNWNDYLSTVSRYLYYV